jgi:hypothetical protein
MGGLPSSPGVDRLYMVSLPLMVAHGPAQGADYHGGRVDATPRYARLADERLESVAGRREDEGEW